MKTIPTLCVYFDIRIYAQILFSKESLFYLSVLLAQIIIY